MDVSKLLLFLSIGTAAMMVPIVYQGARYRIRWSQRILLAVLLTVAGTLGTLLLFYVENGYFGGTSFFGAVLAVPFLFLPVAWLMKLPYSCLMDLCAPAECAMLAVMKVQCCITGCCGGVELTMANTRFVFPSQPVELANGLILCIVLLLMSRNEKYRGRLYPYYLVLYGITRFVLNIFRRAPVIPRLGIPIGNVWSLVSVTAGLVWLYLIQKRVIENEHTI